MDDYEVHVVRCEDVAARSYLWRDAAFVTLILEKEVIGQTASQSAIWDERFVVSPPVTAPSFSIVTRRPLAFVLKDDGWAAKDLGVAWLDLEDLRLTGSRFQYAWLDVEPTESCSDASGRILVGARLLTDAPLSPGGLASPRASLLSPRFKSRKSSRRIFPTDGLRSPRDNIKKKEPTTPYSRAASPRFASSPVAGVVDGIDAMYAKHEHQSGKHSHLVPHSTEKDEQTLEGEEDDVEEVQDQKTVPSVLLQQKEEEEEEKPQPRKSLKKVDATKLGSMFDEADINNDGMISLHEFRHLLEKVDVQHSRALSDEKLQELFEEIDADQSGEVDFAELLTRFSTSRQPRRHSSDGWPPVAEGYVRISAVQSKSDSHWIFTDSSESPKSKVTSNLNVEHFHVVYMKVGVDHETCSEEEEEEEEDDLYLRYSLRWWQDDRAKGPPRGAVSLHWREVDIVTPEIATGKDEAASYRLHLATASAPGSLILDFKSKADLGFWWRCLSTVEARTLSLGEPDDRAVVLDPGFFTEEEDWYGIIDAVFGCGHAENVVVAERTLSPSEDQGSHFDRARGKKRSFTEDDICDDDEDNSSWLVLESVKQLRRRLVEAIIRPQRSTYDMRDLGPRVFTMEAPGSERITVTRSDFDVVNRRGLTLKCSHWTALRGTKAPVIIYVHGNGSSRLEALNGALTVALAIGASLCALDTSGSGQSQGKYVSLGYHESDDIYDVAEYLRRKSGAPPEIALWGRSAGAVASLLTAATKAPILSTVVADSAFASLVALAKELVHQQLQATQTHLPDLMVDIALSWVAGVVEQQANFDLTHVDPEATLGCCFVPVLFIHGADDDFVVPNHSRVLSDACSARSRLLVVKNATHNSHRPLNVLVSIARWLTNELHLPPAPNLRSFLSHLARLHKLHAPPWLHSSESSSSVPSSSTSSTTPPPPPPTPRPLGETS